MFTFVIVLSMLYWTAHLYITVFDYSTVNFYRLLATSGRAASMIILWFICRRFKKYIGHSILLAYIIFLGMQVHNMFVTMKIAPNNNFTAYYNVCNWYVLNCFLLAPSGLFVLIYTVIYAITVFFISYTLLNADHEDYRKEILSSTPIWVFSSFVLFYVLQRRELKRFFEQEKSNKKEE